MPDAVIELDGLSKRYRRRRGVTMAVESLDLAVPAGGVFGFLGPNGAGKTTTIRCLLGLVRPTGGRARILGADCRRDLPSVIGRIGSVVETPALFDGFSGRRNLELLGRVLGIGRRRVDEVLEMVGLAERGGDRVATYSLGMRQRLGLGAALLRDPELLILDEPANGLDPAGIREIRELVRRLGAEGRTVFVSSHLLSEVQLMCDRVAIVARGRCIAAGPVSDVLHAGRRAAVMVGVAPAELDAAAAALARAGLQSTVAGEAGQLRVELDPAAAATVTRALAADGIFLRELRADDVDLETVFLELTEGSGR